MPLPKKNRLTAKKEIDLIFKRGRIVRSSSLFIRFLNNQQKFSRFVFVIPSKYISLAVDRNKVRRILSEEIAKHPNLLKYGRDILVMVFRKLPRKEFKSLSGELGDLLMKVS